MTVAPSIDDLTPAVDLIFQPLLVEALVAIDKGKALEGALPADADPELLAAAIHRLTKIGAIRVSTDEPFGRPQTTARGRALLRLLEQLNAAMTPANRPEITDGSGSLPNEVTNRTSS
jgi:hypothetical protein